MRETGLNSRASEIRTRLGSHPRSRSTSAARGAKAGSGLRRAAELRLRLEGLAIGSRGRADSGISVDDRREIEAEIESVIRKNRLHSSGEAHELSPRKRGLLFPLAVNAIAILVTVSSVFALAAVFGQRDQEIAVSDIRVGSAEGLLLQELKRDSESKLSEKDKAIADIRDRLGSLDKERQDLAGTIDARVKQREAEIRAALQSQLEAERQRLGAQGLSEAAVQARLKAFEASKSSESAKLLEAERAKAAAESAAADENYRKLKEDYQKSMSSLGQERIRLQEEARRSEDALRSSMEAKNKELESRRAAAEAGLAKARSELSSLADRKAKAQAVEDRVIGLYGGLRTALREGRYADAASGAASLAAFLEDPSVAADPTNKDRRAADLFVAQTLGAYARSELERTGKDATLLLRQAELLGSARDAAASAAKALKAGDPSLAAAKYRAALEAVPEILAAHEYFMDSERAAEAGRRTRLADSLAAADKAYRAKDARTAAARYAEALSYLPIPASDREALLSRLAEFGASQADAERAASDGKAARGLLATAARDAAAEDWASALGGYISILSSYPRAEQAGAALAGIEASVAGMRRSSEKDSAASKAAAAKEADSFAALLAAASARATKSEAALAEAQARASALEGELASSRSSLETARAGAASAAEAAAKAASASDAELRARIADLEQRLKDEAERTSRAATESNAALETAALAAKDGEIGSLKAEVQRLKDEASRAAAEVAARDAANRSAAERYSALTESYARFLSREDAASKAGSASDLSSQSNLFSFLSGDEVAMAFPGLRDKVAGYQAAAQKDALEAFPSDAAEIVRQAALFKDRTALEAYYASRRQAYAGVGNQLMVSFISALAASAN